MDFEKNVPEWKATGTEPPESLKESGFEAGYKPPAAFFNWFWNRVSACLTELRNKLKGHAEDTNNPHNVTKEQLDLENVDNTADTEKYVKFAQEAATSRKVDNALTVRFNGGRTANTDMWEYDGSTGRTVNITPDKIGAVNKTGDTITGILYRQGRSGAIGLAIGTASKPECVSIISEGDGTEFNRFCFRQYGANGNRENFNLPITESPESNVNYYILTTKNLVTVEQGGHGASDVAGAQKNLSKPTILTETSDILTLANGFYHREGAISKAQNWPWETSNARAEVVVWGNRNGTKGYWVTSVVNVTTGAIYQNTNYWGEWTGWRQITTTAVT